jgi:hypothetical protein
LETVVASTKSDSSQTLPWLIDSHAYTVLDLVEIDGTKHVVMRATWGENPGLATSLQREGFFLLDFVALRQAFSDLSYTLDATSGDGSPRTFASKDLALTHYHDASLGKTAAPIKTPVHGLRRTDMTLTRGGLVQVDGSALSLRRPTLILFSYLGPDRRRAAQLRDLSNRARRAGYDVAWIAHPKAGLANIEGLQVNIDAGGAMFQRLGFLDHPGRSPGFVTARGDRITSRGLSALAFLKCLGINRKQPIGIDGGRPIR